MEWTDQEIQAIRLNLLNDTNYAAPTLDQLRGLGSLISKGLSDYRRALRIEILREITGISQLNSSKELTLYTVSFLIDYLMDSDSSKENWDLNEKGQRLIKALEARCVERLPEKGKRKSRVEKRSKRVEGTPEEEIERMLAGLNDPEEPRDLSATEYSEAPAETEVEPEPRPAYSFGLEAIMRDLRARASELRHARSLVDQG